VSIDSPDPRSPPLIDPGYLSAADDASVLPTIPSANLNAPTVMLAHKAAMMIVADARGGALR